MRPLYVSALIGPGNRKSVQPIAEGVALGDYDQLHHFIAAGIWDAGPVETELLVQGDNVSPALRRIEMGEADRRDALQADELGCLDPAMPVDDRVIIAD
jgi:hypothetical protein